MKPISQIDNSLSEFVVSAESWQKAQALADHLMTIRTVKSAELVGIKSTDIHYGIKEVKVIITSATKDSDDIKHEIKNFLRLKSEV